MLVACNSYIIISDDKWLINLLDLESDITMTFRLSCVVVIVINSIVSYFYERVIVWQISICWKNREDRKIHREQRLQIEE